MEEDSFYTQRLDAVGSRITQQNEGSAWPTIDWDPKIIKTSALEIEASTIRHIMCIRIDIILAAVALSTSGLVLIFPVKLDST